MTNNTTNKPRKLRVESNLQYFKENQKLYDSDIDNNIDTSSSDVNLFVDCLYFVTKDNQLDCMNSKCSAWAISKIARYRYYYKNYYS